MAKTFNEEKMKSAIASVIRETGADGCVVLVSKETADPGTFEGSEAAFNITLHRMVDLIATFLGTMVREADCNPDYVLNHFVLAYLARVTGIGPGPEFTKTLMKEEKADG